MHSRGRTKLSVHADRGTLRRPGIASDIPDWLHAHQSLALVQLGRLRTGCGEGISRAGLIASKDRPTAVRFRRRTSHGRRSTLLRARTRPSWLASRAVRYGKTSPWRFARQRKQRRHPGVGGIPVPRLTHLSANPGNDGGGCLIHAIDSAMAHPRRPCRCGGRSPRRPRVGPADPSFQRTHSHRLQPSETPSAARCRRW